MHGRGPAGSARRNRNVDLDGETESFISPAPDLDELGMPVLVVTPAVVKDADKPSKLFQRRSPSSSPPAVASTVSPRTGRIGLKKARLAFVALSLCIVMSGFLLLKIARSTDSRSDLSDMVFYDGNGLAPIDPKEFARALHMSMWFYYAQRSGRVGPDNLSRRNPVPWRGDAQLDDGPDGLLSGGFYDAGDFVKFHLPFGFTTTFLAWGALEFGDGYRRLDLLDTLFSHLDHAADYIAACWDGEKQELAAQVGNPKEEHPHWVSPEILDFFRRDFASVPPRTVYYLNQWRPGTEISAEFAAALCAVSLAKQKWGAIDSEQYEKRIGLAKTLYSFAERHPQTFSKNIPDGETFYPSSGYKDELAWGGIWLYKATNDSSFLEKAVSYLPDITPLKPEWTLSWDDKKDGVYALLLDEAKNPRILSAARSWASDSMKFWINEVPKNADGLRVLDGWGSLRLAANQAFLAEYYAKRTDIDRDAYRQFAETQARFMLGQNENGFSFVCGLSPKGRPFPLSPHHRSAHGTWKNDSLSMEFNRHILYGALVGGPGSAETHKSYSHDRGDYKTNEVSIDYNAGFSGMLSALVERKNVDLPGFVVPTEPTGEEFRVEVFEHKVWFHNAIDLKVVVLQTTGWPPRRIPLAYRYFLKIEDHAKESNLTSEFLARLITVKRAGEHKMDGSPEISKVALWNKKESTFFFDVSWDASTAPYPALAHYQYETNIRISFEKPAESYDGVRFDRKKDFSFPTQNGVSTKIPLYSNGQVVYGEEAPKGQTGQ